MAQVIRRIVTGHNSDGKSEFIFNGGATAVKEMESMPGLALTELWRTDGAPADNTGKADALDAFESIGAGHARVEGSDDPMMHKTSTIDYLVVLKGEIWAILDNSEVCLKQGDVMIQRGTNHSWSVRTDEPCLLAAVLVKADPV